jgi:phage gp36-like protein
VAYCTLTDLVDRYGEAEVLAYADRDRDGLADAALVDGVLADVDAEIDTYLAGRYTLPLSETPRVLVRIACELARERLMMAQGARLDAEAPERRAADGARAMLRDIARGVISIGAPVPAASAGSVQMETGGRVWGRADAKGYL